MEVFISCVLPHQERVLSDGPTATMETGVLQLQDRSCGTELRLADISYQRFKQLLDIFVRVLRLRRIVTNC